MLNLYYKSDRNSMKIQQMNIELYSENRQPHRKIFKKLDENITQFGSFEKPRLKSENRMDEKLELSISKKNFC